MVRIELAITSTTQQAPLQPSEPMVTDQASRRAYIGSMESADVCRTHSIPEPTIHAMGQFVTSTITDESQREKELLRFIGNSIPVMTLHDVVQHLLSLLNW